MREFGTDTHTLLYLKRGHQPGPTVWHSVAAYMGGESGGARIHVFAWLSPFAMHLKLSQRCLLIDHAPIQSKKKNSH